MSRISLPRRRFILIAIAIPAIAWAAVTYESLKALTRDSQSAENTELEVELVTLRPDGFEPLAIRRSKGPFVLFVDDRTGKSDSSLSLLPETGERLLEVKTQRKQSGWHRVLNLPAGNYILTDTANPELKCQITILP